MANDLLQQQEAVLAVEPMGAPVEAERPGKEAKREHSTRRKRSLKLDKEAIVAHVLETVRHDLNDRTRWMQRRRDRYAKSRGWLPTKDWPLGEASSNAYLPVIQTASLRIESTLHNALLGQRPVMQSKARQKRNMEKEQRIDQLLDSQVFLEAHGEERLDSFVTNYVNDGTAIAFVPWIFQKDYIHDVRVGPPLEPIQDHISQLLERLQQVLPGLTKSPVLPPGDDSGWNWDVTFDDDQGEHQEARVEFYERDDDKLEAHIAWQAVSHDGPAILVDDLEDIVVPRRSANAQPPSAMNPHGARYICRLGRATVDDIRRRWKDGTYDLLTEEDMDAIAAAQSADHAGVEEDGLKEDKDKDEGIERGFGETEEQTRQVLEWYGRWDVNGDDLEEDVIFWVERDSEKLCRARLLTEIYPGIPPRRPVAECRFITIPNRFYGIGLPELLEPIQDLTLILVNQNIDWGTIRNTPFGFYRAASGLKSEVMRYFPGELYPLDDPQRDVNFPQMGNATNAWSFNMLQVLQQFAERLGTVGDLQMGRVPRGGSEALRTVGATMALLGQGDIRSEQILRRLFRGIAEIYALIHRLNRRYLSRTKEYRIIGVPEEGEEIYGNISPDDIQADVDFDFKATMFNTNKQVLGETLKEALAVILSPLAIQMKLIDRPHAVKLIRDFYAARDLDADRYIPRLPASESGPHLLAEEALSMIVAGERPTGRTLESASEHLQKLREFQDYYTGELLDTPFKRQLFEQWIASVEKLVAEEQMVQQQVLAARQMQGMMQGGQNGQGQAPPVEPPPMAQVGEGQMMGGAL